MEQTLCHLEYFATEGKRSSISKEFNLLDYFLHYLSFLVPNKIAVYSKLVCSSRLATFKITVPKEICALLCFCAISVQKWNVEGVGALYL